MSRSAPVKPNSLASFTSFGDLLRYLRQRSHLTQRDLAVAAGYSVSQISRLEHNERLPDEITLLSVFVPALGLEQEPVTAERLLLLAHHARGDAAANPASPATSRETLSNHSAASQTAPRLTNLPYRLTSFIGRELELRDLISLLAEPGVRIITLLAPGGMGKTCLAIETAARSIGNFADGACFVALAQIGSPADLVTAIGSAAGLGFHGAGEPKQQLFDFLREQALLLVLDNFEHLVAGAPLVTEILEAVSGIKVLITSREKLNLSGETVYWLGGMKVPDTAADPLSFDSVRLFLQHARRVHHNFSADDLSSIARIAQLTQGMPLGLVLAAAWADVLSPAQIADEISEGIDVLQQDLCDIPLRHRSIRAVFDPTWERLSKAQRDVFMKLSVLRGGFTRQAAQAVADADLRMLSHLVGKSLIQPQPDQRFAIHELLRQYGESHLDQSGAATTTYAAHSTFFMDFLAQREADVKGRRQTAAIQEISADFENIRNAWLWSLAHHQFAAIERALECLVIAGETTGRLLETQAILQQSADRLVVQAEALWERIIVRLARLDYALRNDSNFDRVEAILARARERSEAREVAWCLWVLGDREAIINRRDQQAQLLYEELITLCRATRNDYFLAHGLTGVSWRYANNGEVARAVDALRECIAIRQKIGDVKNLDFTTTQLGWMTFDLLQDAEAAEALLDEQITLQSKTGTTTILPIMVGIKAAIAFWRNDRNATRDLAQKGIDLARNQNYLGGQNMCQGSLGLVESCAGNYKQAQRLCQDVASSGFSNLTAFLSYWSLALASYGLGDETSSRRSLMAAMQIACRFKSPTFQGMCLLLVTVVYLGKYDPQRGVEYLSCGFSQPAHLTNWLHNWSLLNDIRAQLQSQLGPEMYSAAWGRGQALDLNTEAAKVLAELQALR